jgi:hypothetical protein
MPATQRSKTGLYDGQAINCVKQASRPAENEGAGQPPAGVSERGEGGRCKVKRRKEDQPCKQHDFESREQKIRILAAIRML